jgi:lysophospholipase L1-like esterase
MTTMRALTLSFIVLTVAVSAQTPATSTPPATIAPAAAPQGAGRGGPPLPDLTCPDLAAALRTMNSNDPRVRDWPAMNRYREANHSVKDARVVFMGDSITDNWQQPRFGGFFPGKPYVDRGIGGQTTPQMLLRFRNDVINLRPKAVVILAGTNDIAGNTGPMSDEDIEGNLATMSELAHAHQIKVVFSSITPVSSYHLATPNANPQTSQRPMDRIRGINDWMKKYAADHGDVYLDYFSAMVDDKGLLRAELSADDLHPTTAGYAIMAPLAEAAIAKAIK